MGTAALCFRVAESKKFSYEIKEEAATKLNSI